MPTYQYTCTECGDQVEAVQKFTDAPLTVCTACGGRLRKVFFPAGIVFKGSGFYRTDSRNGSSPKPAAAKEAKEKQTSDSGASGSSSESKAADKPAAKTESSSAKSGSSSGEKAA